MVDIVDRLLTGHQYTGIVDPLDREAAAEIRGLRAQLSMANCWNNTIIEMAGLKGSWSDGGVSVRQVVEALRTNTPG